MPGDTSTGSIRAATLAQALSMIRPEHLPAAMAALGLKPMGSRMPPPGPQVLKAPNGNDYIAETDSQGEPDVFPAKGVILGPENLPNPVTAADAAAPGGLANQKTWNGVSQQWLQQLNQNLPQNQMAQILRQQEQVQNDPLSRLKDFLAASQGFDGRGGLHPSNPLSLNYKGK